MHVHSYEFTEFTIIFFSVFDLFHYVCVQAGYSPIMLAALAGFEKKNDKYILQRLFRLGNINKESAEVFYHFIYLFFFL